MTRDKRAIAILASGLLLLACGKDKAGVEFGPPVDANPPPCEADSRRCSAGILQTCEATGWVGIEVCESACDAVKGCVPCPPGQNHCFDDSVYACDADGNRSDVVEICTGENHCSDAACSDLCANAAATHSYIGCEYWAVDLDNAIEVFEPGNGAQGCQAGSTTRNDLLVCYTNAGPIKIAGLCDENNTCPLGFNCELSEVCVFDAQHSPFAIVVSNPQSFAVTITLSNSVGVSHVVMVEPGGVHTLFPQSLGFQDTSIDHSGITSSAYKLISNAPIVAYQFNPLDNVDVFSNDGSILLPRTAYGEHYYGVTQPAVVRRPLKNDYNGYLSVVAWQDGTEVTVTPTTGVRPQGTFLGINAGESANFTLDAFEVLHLESIATGDLTGSTVASANNKTFAVFSGHEAVTLPHASNSCCADHLEEQMFPSQTWGVRYAVARSQPRGVGESDVYRVLAQRDGTVVTVNPPVGICPTLSAGDFCTINVATDIEVTATEPILLVHYLKSVNSQQAFATGDPSMALSVPTEQFRSTYSFLVPEAYEEQYISIVALSGQALVLDGVDISGQLESFASGSYSGARISVLPGAHDLQCAGGCGLEVYGYSDSVSYLFAGGLDLKPIVVD